MPLVRRIQIVLFRVWKRHSIRKRQTMSESSRLMVSCSNDPSIRVWSLQKIQSKISLLIKALTFCWPFFRSYLKSPKLFFCIRCFSLSSKSWYFRAEIWLWESEFNTIVLHTWNILAYPIVIAYFVIIKISKALFKEFNDDGLTVQNNLAHTTNQNILNCHVWPA